MVRQSPTSRTQINKSSDVLSRIQPIGFDPNEGIKVLMYGQSGSGKTTLWATFPGPILAILASGGFRPGELRSVDTPENRDRISSVVLHSVADAHEIIEHVKTGPYQTVVLDHVTGLQDLTLKEVLGLDTLPAQKSWGMASQQHYGTSTQQCKEIIRALLNLTINVVIVGQERVFGKKGEEDTNNDVIKPTVSVSATESLASWITPACDYVIQMFKRPKMVTRTVKFGNKEVESLERGKGVDYCARTEVHDVFATKFRVPKGHPLPNVVVNPDYEKLMGVIRGELVEGAEYPT